MLGSNNVHNQSGQVDTRYSTKYAFTAVLGNVWGWLRKRSLFRATKLEVLGLPGLSIGVTWLEKIKSIFQINEEASGSLMNVDL